GRRGGPVQPADLTGRAAAVDPAVEGERSRSWQRTARRAQAVAVGSLEERNEYAEAPAMVIGAHARQRLEERLLVHAGGPEREEVVQDEPERAVIVGQGDEAERVARRKPLPGEVVQPRVHGAQIEVGELGEEAVGHRARSSPPSRGPTSSRPAAGT